MFAQVIVDSQSCLEPSFIARYIDPILPYCGIINCFLTFVALIVACFGLKQISLARKAAKVNAKRDALKIAAEQCNLYAEKVIPFSHKLRSNQMYSQFNKCFTFSVKKSNIYVTPQKGIKIKGEKDLAPYDSDFIQVFNQIESFSQYLTSGLADEMDAYKCLGNVHLSIVSPFIPLLVLRDQLGPGQNWRNTLKLFVTWYERQQQEIIDRKQQELSKTKEILEEEKAQHNVEPICILDVDTFYKWNAKLSSR